MFYCTCRLWYPSLSHLPDRKCILYLTRRIIFGRSRIYICFNRIDKYLIIYFLIAHIEQWYFYINDRRMITFIFHLDYYYLLLLILTCIWIQNECKLVKINVICFHNTLLVGNVNADSYFKYLSTFTRINTN